MEKADIDKLEGMLNRIRANRGVEEEHETLAPPPGVYERHIRQSRPRMPKAPPLPSKTNFDVQGESGLHVNPQNPVGRSGTWASPLPSASTKREDLPVTFVEVIEDALRLRPRA
jgi:hypothetical protein